METLTTTEQLAANTTRPVFKAPSDGPAWDLLLIHIADTAGVLWISTQSGNPGLQSYAMLPLNVAVPIVLAPGSKLWARSLGGERFLSVVATPRASR